MSIETPEQVGEQVVNEKPQSKLQVPLGLNPGTLKWWIYDLAQKNEDRMNDSSTLESQAKENDPNPNLTESKIIHIITHAGNETEYDEFTGLMNKKDELEYNSLLNSGYLNRNDLLKVLDFLSKESLLTMENRFLIDNPNIKSVVKGVSKGGQLDRGIARADDGRMIPIIDGKLALNVDHIDSSSINRLDITKDGTYIGEFSDKEGERSVFIKMPGKVAEIVDVRTLGINASGEHPLKIEETIVKDNEVYAKMKYPSGDIDDKWVIIYPKELAKEGVNKLASINPNSLPLPKSITDNWPY